MLQQCQWASESAREVSTFTTMSAITSTEETKVSTVVKPLTTLKPIKKLKPARKQVKPGDVEKKEDVQTGKEYSECLVDMLLNTANNEYRHLVQQMGRR